MTRKLFLILFLTCISCFAVNAQQNEETTNTTRMYGAAVDVDQIQSADTSHSPRMAALYSAILPGAGQFYNKKYWKIPLIYGLGAFAAYQIKSNHQNFLIFLNVYTNLRDGNPENNDAIKAYEDRLSETIILRRLQRFRRDRDYWIILSGLFYALNIVDATVDAHLREFDINQNLSMKLEPSIQSNPYTNFQAGLSLSFTIKGKNTN